MLVEAQDYFMDLTCENAAFDSHMCTFQTYFLQS